MGNVKSEKGVIPSESRLQFDSPHSGELPGDDEVVARLAARAEKIFREIETTQQRYERALRIAVRPDGTVRPAHAAEAAARKEVLSILRDRLSAAHGAIRDARTDLPRREADRAKAAEEGRAAAAIEGRFEALRLEMLSLGEEAATHRRAEAAHRATASLSLSEIEERDRSRRDAEAAQRQAEAAARDRAEKAEAREAASWAAANGLGDVPAARQLAAYRTYLAERAERSVAYEILRRRPGTTVTEEAIGSTLATLRDPATGRIPDEKMDGLRAGIESGNEMLDFSRRMAEQSLKAIEEESE